jgi:hypothetical protein
MELSNILNKPLKIHSSRFSRIENSKGDTTANPGALECLFEICSQVRSSLLVHFEFILSIDTIRMEKNNCFVWLYATHDRANSRDIKED